MTSSQTTGSDKPQAVSGISVRTWLVMAVGLTIGWVFIGCLILR